MYFGTKFDTVVTQLLLLQEPKGGKVRLSDKTNGFWKFEQEMHNGSKAKYVTVQPLLMFNKITSSNKLDIPIQDHEITFNTDDLLDTKSEQEIVCWDTANSLITCYYDEQLGALDDQYVCNTNQKITGDVEDIIHPSGDIDGT